MSNPEIAEASIILQKYLPKITAAFDRIGDHLTSPAVSDSNFENANVVDVLDNISRGLFAIADAIKGDK